MKGKQETKAKPELELTEQQIADFTKLAELQKGIATDGKARKRITDAYRAFMERSVEYLDVRYRKNVEPRTSVKLTTYNQVVAAILKIQTRIYNERDNLGYYDDDIREENDRLTELLIGAAEDLKTKRIVRPEE